MVEVLGIVPEGTESVTCDDLGNRLAALPKSIGGSGEERGSDSGSSHGDASTRCPPNNSSSGTTSNSGSGEASCLESTADTTSGVDELGRCTLQRDGAVESVGSKGHPTACTPCAFYCFSLRGCRSGVQCGYCHLFHQSKLRRRREEWKQLQRTRRISRKSVDSKDFAEESEEDCAPSASPGLMGPTLADACEMPLPPPTRLSAPAAAAPEPAACQQDFPVQTSMDFFVYTPNSAVVGAGQSVEMMPPMQMITAGMVFAVAPDLPEGLILDERAGVIHGRPQRGTDGSRSFFLTACEPGSLNIRIAMVNIKVVDRTPNYERRTAQRATEGGGASLPRVRQAQGGQLWE